MKNRLVVIVVCLAWAVTAAAREEPPRPSAGCGGKAPSVPGESVVAESEDFESASSVEEVRRQIEKLPKDTSWWNVNGADMAWNNKNLNRVFPTVNVYRAGPVRQLERRPMAAIASFKVDTPGGPMAFADFLRSDLSTCMGMVILHRGEIVFEDYPRMPALRSPIYWSVTKVLVSTVVSILEDRGQVEIDTPIENYIPQLAGSSYAGITVRNILDMATGIDCPEEYYDTSSCYYRLMETTGEAIWTEKSADNPYEYIASLEVGKYAEQGTSFEYGSINTYILGWLVEKITGMPFQDAFSREVWTQIGAESDATRTVPLSALARQAEALDAALQTAGTGQPARLIETLALPQLVIGTGAALAHTTARAAEPTLLATLPPAPAAARAFAKAAGALPTPADRG